MRVIIYFLFFFLLNCTPALKIASGNPDGTYHRMAQSLAAETDLKLQVVSSSGSGENLSLLKNKKVDLAFCQLDILQNLIFSDPELALNVYIIEELYREEVHLIQKKSKPLSWPLQGDFRIGTGPANSGTAATAMILLGYGEADLKRLNLVDTDPGAALKKLNTGELDGFFLVGGIPFPLLSGDIADLSLLELPEKLLETLQTGTFFYRKATIPQETYPWLDKPVTTLSVSSVLLSSKELPDDQIERVINQIHNNKEKLEMVHPKWQELNKSGIEDITFQLQDFVHPYRR
jgi:TRAP transporter TAXI family solute receptor